MKTMTRILATAVAAARAQIAERDDNLDIVWLKDEAAGEGDELPEPAVLAREALEELEGALEDLRGILSELGEDVDEEVGR